MKLAIGLFCTIHKNLVLEDSKYIAGTIILFSYWGEGKSVGEDRHGYEKFAELVGEEEICL